MREPAPQELRVGLCNEEEAEEGAEVDLGQVLMAAQPPVFGLLHVPVETEHEIDRAIPPARHFEGQPAGEQDAACHPMADLHASPTQSFSRKARQISVSATPRLRRPVLRMACSAMPIWSS